MLFVLVSAAGPPGDPEPIVGAVLGLVERCDEEHREQAVQLALVAAARWKSMTLADRVMEHVLAQPDVRKSHIGATAEYAVAAAAAQADAEAMREDVASRLSELAFGSLDREAASTLANFLDLATNAMPAWAPSLERLRVAALLAA